MNQEQKQHLKALAKRHGDTLTPDLVVAEAKRKDSPLHDLFEWDVRKAATAHWVYRARELIACITVEVTYKTSEVRVVPAFVRDPTKAADEQGYIGIHRVRSDAEIAAGVMLAELGRVEAALQRARAVAAALDGESTLDDIAQRVATFRRTILKQQQQPGAH